MKLKDLVPDLTPEQLAECEIKVHVDWVNRKVQFAVVNEDNVAVAVRELETSVAAPQLKTQADFWKVHHNPWLD